MARSRAAKCSLAETGPAKDPHAMSTRSVRGRKKGSVGDKRSCENEVTGGHLEADSSFKSVKKPRKRSTVTKCEEGPPAESQIRKKVPKNTRRPSRGSKKQQEIQENTDLEEKSNDILSNENSGNDSPVTLRKKRLEKLARLSKMKLECQKNNREEFREELKRKAEKNQRDSHIERLKHKAITMLQKKKLEEEGKEYERIKLLNYTIESVENWNEIQEEKAMNTGEGFTDYIQSQSRKYRKQVAKLHPDYNAYKESKESQKNASISGNSFNDLLLASKPSIDGVKRVVHDLKEQDKKRASFSRRRIFDYDENITYINERNMRFNRKISRAYDKYTSEIRENFERGTAV